MRVPALKVCGLTRRADAVAAVDAGAAYLGAVFVAESPRALGAAAAAALFHGLDARRVGVFVDAPVAEIAAVAATAGLDVVQLHGDESPARLRALRSAGPWRLWKALRVRDAASVGRAVERFGDVADGILLDGWAAGARGGTGRRFDWAAVAPLRAGWPAELELVVAGGLRAGNVVAAVELLNPEAVDVSSGVETAPGVKDAAAIVALMDTLQSIGRCR